MSTVGVAGFTLGGGEGWLGRQHGLACDNLMAAEVVTASGDIVRADETENPDLLWALVYRVPPIEIFPEAWHGDLVLAFVIACMGPVEEGERRLAPFRDRDGMLLDGLAPQPYVDLQRWFDETMGPGNRWYSRAHYLDVLSDAAIDAFLGHLEPLPGEFTTANLVAGGAAP